MAGVTDAPFRSLCQAYGAGLTTSEMLSAKSELWDRPKSRLRLISHFNNFSNGLNDNIKSNKNTQNNPAPYSVQIVGSEPEQLALGASNCVAHGAQIIDINMGCPVKKVCHKAAGSALLKDEALVARILEAVIAAVDVPVTLKIRTGWDTENRNAVNIAKIAENSGIQALAIHGRTRACRFNGVAEYDTIAAVKAAVSIPVIANGDIDSVAKALQVIRYTKADGIMLGRSAQGQPWIFQQITDALAGKSTIEPDIKHKLHCMYEHVSAMHTFYGEVAGLRIARKHVTSYLEKMGFESTTRKAFNTIENVNAQLDFLKQLYKNTLKGKAA